jgi:hypothetical protein
VASIMPAVILAVALAFSTSTAWAIAWAAVSLSLQLLLQLMLRQRLRKKLATGRQETDGPAPTTGLTLHTDAPDYSHAEILRSPWWLSTTADALMVGRQAYGYVAWQHGGPQTLSSLLQGGRPAGEAPEAAPASLLEQPANVLALQRSSMAGQSLTFAVFRDEP